MENVSGNWASMLAQKSSWVKNFDEFQVKLIESKGLGYNRLASLFDHTCMKFDFGLSGLSDSQNQCIAQLTDTIHTLVPNWWQTAN